MKKASLSVIFITVFIDLMGFGILIPILPTFASKELAISDFGIGVIIAIFSLVQFLFNPVLGKLSDKIGRRPVILGSLLFTVVSYILFSFSDTFLMLFVSRLLAGFGGSNIGVAQAYIADITSKEERSKGMGLIGAAFGLGFVFGPMIGGFLSKYGYDIAGLGAAGISFLAFIFAIFALPESNLAKTESKKFGIKLFDLKFTKETMKRPVIGTMILLFFIIVFSMANIYGTFSIIAYKVYHFTDQEIGYLFGLIGIIGAVIQGGAIRYISNKFSDRSLVLWGTILMSIGLGMIPYGQNFIGVAIVASILAIGTGLLQPTILSMISRFSPDHEQGAILGLNQSASAFARVLGPLWGGFSYDFLGYEAPFLTGAFFTLLTFLIVLIFLNSQQLEQAAET
ncbi:MAG: MFS transporter [Ignavibacteriales bacterium]|jgi:multidrug resistance protein|nr:MAG: MFS transporter [Ignavibacteriales bacterium]